jgi:hypothetical protein
LHVNALSIWICLSVSLKLMVLKFARVLRNHGAARVCNSHFELDRSSQSVCVVSLQQLILAVN